MRFYDIVFKWVCSIDFGWKLIVSMFYSYLQLYKKNVFGDVVATVKEQEVDFPRGDVGYGVCNNGQWT